MNKIKFFLFILLFAIGANAQSSFICEEVPLAGRITDGFGYGVSATISLRATNGSPDLVTRSNFFGLFLIKNAVSCELYEVKPLNLKYRFLPDVRLINPIETPFVEFQTISEE